MNHILDGMVERGIFVFASHANIEYFQALAHVEIQCRFKLGTPCVV